MSTYAPFYAIVVGGFKFKLILFVYRKFGGSVLGEEQYGYSVLGRCRESCGIRRNCTVIVFSTSTYYRTVIRSIVQVQYGIDLKKAKWERN